VLGHYACDTEGITQGASIRGKFARKKPVRANGEELEDDTTALAGAAHIRL
jgi:hypothetical protein